MTRPIHEIANDIRRDWDGKDKGINAAAIPYLVAMYSLHSITDNHTVDTGRSIVISFLFHARSYRGPTARALKAELKEILNTPGVGTESHGRSTGG